MKQNSNIFGILYETSTLKNIPVVRQFLDGAEESRQYAVFGSLGLTYQSLENVQLRNHYRMRPEMTGILVNKIESFSGAQGILEKYDIILAIDGVPIGNDETSTEQERLSLDHMVSMKKPGETALIKVLRKGKEHEYSIILKPVKPNFQVQQYYHLQSYYIFAGFIFCPLNNEYVSKDVVVVSKVISDDINVGYDSFEGLMVEEVNEVEVKNLKHLCEMIEVCRAEDLRLDLITDRVIVLNYKSAKKATCEILERHNIKSAISKDLITSMRSPPPPKPIDVPPQLVDDPIKDTKIDILPTSSLPMQLAVLDDNNSRDTIMPWSCFSDLFEVMFFKKCP